MHGYLEMIARCDSQSCLSYICSGFPTIPFGQQLTSRLQRLLDIVWHYLILPVFNSTLWTILTVLRAFPYFICTALFKNKCEKKYMKICTTWNKSYRVVAIQCIKRVNVCSMGFCVFILNSTLSFLLIPRLLPCLLWSATFSGRSREFLNVNTLFLFRKRTFFLTCKSQIKSGEDVFPVSSNCFIKHRSEYLRIAI